MLMNVQAGKVYRNIKTGDRYRIVCIARAAWDSEQELVVYHLANGQAEPLSRWVRSMNEFRGKFEEVTE